MRNWIILLFVLGFVLSGCSTGQQNYGKGIAMSLLPNMPRTDSISEGNEFRVGVHLRNNGLRNVDGELCVSDVWGAEFGGIEISKDCQPFSLSGAEENDGELAIRDDKFYFPSIDSGYIYKDIEGELATKIKAEISYDYEVIADAQICIGADQSSCKLDETISGNKLGIAAATAPVTVTKVEKSVTPGVNTAGVRLKIYVQNVGGGKVISGNEEDEKEKVQISVGLVGGGVRFNCLPTDNGIIFLENGAKTIDCNANIELAEGDESNILEIALGYKYKSALTTGDIKLIDTD